MRRDQQVHPRRADRQLLFPLRDLVVSDGGGDQHHQTRCLLREVERFLEVGRPRCGIGLGQRFGEQIGERRALFGSDDDEPPREQFAMIRRARGNGQDALQLGRARPGRDHLARAARPAGFEQRQGRVTVVEHGGGRSSVVIFAQQSTSQGDFRR